MNIKKPRINDIPLALEENVEMQLPNAPLLIFKGDFQLFVFEKFIKVNGSLFFIWQPSLGVRLECTINQSESIGIHDFMLVEDFEIIIDKETSFKAFISRVTSNSNVLEAVIYEMPVFGNKSIPVDTIKFSIPNLKRIHGDAVRRELVSGQTNTSSRIVLTNKKFEFILDMRHGYKELSEILKKEGGHLPLYNGQLKKIKKNSSISYVEIDNQIRCLNCFLTFLNGRRVGAMLFKGEHENNNVWTDYRYYATENYQSTFSWSGPFIKSEIIGQLWKDFCEIWNDKENNQFLILAIKWYSEANMNEVSADTRLIMAQSTLELIYNWWIIEKEKLISEDDAKNLKAANKIKLVLSHLNLSYAIPNEYSELKNLMKLVNLNDGPNMIVYVRNCLVHSNSKKRQDVFNISPMARAEVVFLANWYIELSLLKILNYNGLYQRRTIGNEYVPWAKMEIFPKTIQ